MLNAINWEVWLPLTHEEVKNLLSMFSAAVIVLMALLKLRQKGGLKWLLTFGADDDKKEESK